MRSVIAAIGFSLATSAALAEVPTPMAKPRSGVTADDALIAQKLEDAKAIADCQHHWDPGTHMTREVWARTCRRVQERFRKLDLR
jgi:hypothetical protein